ncbi:MAG TPA: TolC family protein, partial [Chitinophagaceae bacterium]
MNWEADKEQTNKLKNDIALNVAAAYLQVLLAKEQARIAEVQVTQTINQLETTRKRVDAGALPELNAAELEAQLARDSSGLITAETTAQQFLLQMKALLNLDAATPFDIVVPPVENIPVEPLAELQPDAVYAKAMTNLPQQKVNSLRIQSAMKSVSAAKGRMYPTISAFGSLSTNAVHFKRAMYDQVLVGYENSGARVNAGGGVFYPVEIPEFTDGTNLVGYFKPDNIGRQFSNNFGQSVGIGISVPIFNGRSARSAWDRSKLNLQSLELQKEQSEMQLKQ